MIKEIDGKRWYCCPHCGQKLFVIELNAHCSGIKIKCKGRGCGREIQVNFKVNTI